MNKINIEISQLMQDVQNAALESDTDPTQADYIQDVNRRIGEIEKTVKRALDLYHDRETNEMSVNDIVKVTGVPESTLYHKLKNSKSEGV